MAEVAAGIPTHRAPPPARLSYLAKIAAGAALVALGPCFLLRQGGGGDSCRLRPRPARRPVPVDEASPELRSRAGGGRGGVRVRRRACRGSVVARAGAVLALRPARRAAAARGPVRRWLALVPPGRPGLPQPARPAPRPLPRRAAPPRPGRLRRGAADPAADPRQRPLPAPVHRRQPADRERVRAARSGGVDASSILRLGFWLRSRLVWSLLRPRRLALAPARGKHPDRLLPGVSLASITLSLLAFNLIFALQNGLDLAFLWSGAPLPGGHDARRICPSRRLSADRDRLARRPVRAGHLAPRLGHRRARAPIRLLVTLWIAQNLLLVASTMLRTFDYIEAYSLTRAAHRRLDLDGRWSRSAWR